MNDSAASNDVIIEAWNTLLFDKFMRFRHQLINGLSRPYVKPDGV